MLETVYVSSYPSGLGDSFRYVSSMISRLKQTLKEPVVPLEANEVLVISASLKKRG